MGIQSTSSIEVSPSTDVPDCIQSSIRIHPCSGLTARQDEGTTGGSDPNANSGIDVKLFGEEDICEIKNGPTCDCVNHKPRNGIHKVLMPDGTVGYYGDPAPHKIQKQSEILSLQNSQGPTGNGGDEFLILGPLSLEVKTQCSVQCVEFFVDICGWNARPESTKEITLENLTIQATTGTGGHSHGIEPNPITFQIPISQAAYWQGVAKWTMTVNDEVRAEDECFVAGNGGSMYAPVGAVNVPPASVVKLEMNLFVRYTGAITSNYDMTLSRARIMATCTEQTALEGPPDESVC